MEHTLPYTGQTPVRGTVSSAGLDLRTSEGFTLVPGEAHMVETDTCVAIPDGHVGLITMRSKYGAQGIRCHIGLIDADYRGPILVHVHLPFSSDLLIFNPQADTSPVSINVARFYGNQVVVAPGERFAQLTILPFASLTPTLVDALDDTARTGGFGSTG